MIGKLNFYCNGIQHYSVTKVSKMKLIVGEALLVDDVAVTDFDVFGMTLG